MNLDDGWEKFYTDSKIKKDRVDEISIDIKNRRYILYLNEDITITDGEDSVEASYVSRFIFEIILNGITNLGFVEVKNV